MDKKDFLKKSQAPNTVILSYCEFAKDIFTFSITKDKKGVKRIFLHGLYREGIIKLLNELGFYKRYHDNNAYDFIRDENNILDEVEPCNIKDVFMSRVNIMYAETQVFEYEGIQVSVEAAKLHEVFLLQSHLIFNDTFLEHLPNHTKPILRDTKTESFFPFLNKVVKVTANGMNLIEYSDLAGFCIWRKHLLQREYLEGEYTGCHFDKFIRNISNNEQERITSIESAIGYLLHNYSHLSNGQAVIAYDEEITDLKNPMGGTGKGIIKQAIAQLRTVIKIDGKKFDEKDRFCFQEVDERTQVVFFDDIKADLGFDRFNSILTEGWNIEKKRLQTFFIPPQESPKVYITSNAIIQGEGTTFKRRQFIIELSPFYSNLIKQKLEPIRHTHGCDFFGAEWDKQEWGSFYSYMLQCVQSYLGKGLISCEQRGLKANKTRQGTSDDFYEWVSEKTLETNKEYNLKEMFMDFKSTYYGEISDVHQRTFTNWLKMYALINDLEYKTRRSNGITLMKLQCISA